MAEAPFIGIYRASKFEVGKNVPPMRTGSLLRKGARVVLLGGKEGLQHRAASRLYRGPVHEVVLDRRGEPVLREVREDEIMLAALYNANRRIQSGPVPALNSDSVRLAASKSRVYTRTLSGISPKTFVADPRHIDFVSLREHLLDDELMVKPATGSGGRGVESVSRQQVEFELKARFAAHPNEQQIVQERIQAHPWPKYIRAKHPEEQAALHATGQEMRVFSVNNTFVPIARVLNPGDTSGIHRTNDRYIALDPESVPARVYETAAQADNNLYFASGTTERSTALDLRYGTRPSDGYSSPDWWLTDLNVIDPQFPDPIQYVALSHELYDARADQLVRMATTTR